MNATAIPTTPYSEAPIARRVAFLETVKPDSEDLRLRNLRVVAELRWCLGVIRNGGAEPEEWRDEHEEDKPEFDAAS